MTTVLLLLTLVLLVACWLSLRRELGASPKVPPHLQVQLYAPAVCAPACIRCVSCVSGAVGWDCSSGAADSDSSLLDSVAYSQQTTQT